MGNRRAVFLDRDGTVSREIGYMRDPSKIRLLAGSARAIASLRAAGFKAVLVTNQSGVDRGYFPASFVTKTHARLQRLLRDGGTRLDAIYACPHLPRRNCSCRKPRLGLLRRARRRFGLRLSSCYVVGDKASDTALAKNAGCPGIHVLTGYGRQQRRMFAKRGAARPAFIARDLAAAARWIIARERKIR